MSTAENLSWTRISSVLIYTLIAALALIFLPSSALAYEEATTQTTEETTTTKAELSFSRTVANELKRTSSSLGVDSSATDLPSSFGSIHDQLHEGVNDALAQVNKILPMDWQLIAQVGNQAQSGHNTCCPGYACAYGDVILDGTVHDHAYYGCGSCIWRDWGGGNSSYRCVGSSQDLLREAYEQIKQGRPTVVHVRASYGQHWITLFGYQNVYDVEHLSLDNFLALDPWDASQLTASERFSLYGDGCEHISSR